MATVPGQATTVQPGDEPVWVKDDDEDLEELVVLNLDKEPESTARQIDLQARVHSGFPASTGWSVRLTRSKTSQVQLCMVLFCTLLALISLIALSWLKYGGIIMRSRHDPNWKVRELSPSVSPNVRGRNKKKD